MKENINTLIKKFLIKNPFYAYLLLNLNATYSREIDVAAIKFENSKYHLLLNPDIISLLNDESIGVILQHEFLHILNGHLSINSKLLNHKLVNIACDLAINDLLYSSIYYIHKKDFYLNNKSKPITEYNNLVQSKGLIKTVKEHGLLFLNSLLFNKEYNLSLDNKKSWRYYYERIKNIKGLQNSNISTDLILKENISEESIKEQEIISKKLIEKIISDTKKANGKLPNAVDEYIKTYLKKTKNWKNELHRFINNSLKFNLKFNLKKSNKKRSKRFYAMPGKTKNKTLNILVALDTSGSISEEQLNQFVNELNKIASYHEVTCLQFDVGISDIRKFNKKALLGYNYNFQIFSRGGTSFDEPLEYYNNNDYDLLIMFTDGYASTPDFKVKDPVLWVLTKDYNSNNKYKNKILLEV